MILERVIDGLHLLGEAINVRSMPKGSTVDRGKKPAKGIGWSDNPAVSATTGTRQARSVDLSRLSPPKVDGSPSMSASSDAGWSWHPVLQVIYGMFTGGRVRTVVVEGAPPPDVELMVLHREYPAAMQHPARLSNACGLCIMFQRQGLPPAYRELGERCPGCGNVRGHARDCDDALLAEFGIRAQDWEPLPNQGPSFDEFVEANRRRGYLPRGDEGPPW